MLFLLMAIVAATYVPSTRNGFSADDHMLFTGNVFYDRLSNMSRLFSRDYTTQPSIVQADMTADKGSGSCAYRPVLSATYFIDTWFWHKNPFGYHLTNLVIHLVSTVLVFLLLQQLLKGVSFFPVWGAALLFGVYPVHAEAVHAIGFRADLLSTFFVLGGCLIWTRNTDLTSGRVGYIAAGCYLMALLSKENALLMPFLLIAYDHVFSRRIPWKSYIPFGVSALSYLTLYFFVFPNSAFADMAFQTRGVWEWSLVGAGVLGIYISGYLFPLAVRTIPGLYYPLPSQVSPVLLLLMVVLVAGVATWLFCALRERRPVGLLVLWTILFWLPACSLIPNPNPVAYRYLYLPSIGVLPCAVLLLRKIFRIPAISKRLPTGFIIAVGTLAMAAAGTTFFNAAIWRTNFSLGAADVLYFPDYYKGHLLIGSEYFLRHDFKKTSRHLETAFSDPRMNDPQVTFLLAESLLQCRQMKKARFYFQRLVLERPDYTRGLLGMGKWFWVQGNKSAAQLFFEAALRQVPGLGDVIEDLKQYPFTIRETPRP